jgi:hypothetical protein
MKLVRLILWLALCAACLAIAQLKPDGGIIYIVPLLALTFPTGILGYSAFSLLYDLGGTSWGWDTGHTTASRWGYLVTSWALIVGCGYIQWFVVVPWVMKRLRRLAA